MIDCEIKTVVENIPNKWPNDVLEWLFIINSNFDLSSVEMHTQSYIFGYENTSNQADNLFSDKPAIFAYWDIVGIISSKKSVI